MLGTESSVTDAADSVANAGATVTVVVRGDSIMASMYDYLVKELEGSAMISVLLNAEIIEAGSGIHLDRLVVRNRLDQSTTSMPVDALFVFIGAKPGTA